MNGLPGLAQPGSWRTPEYVQPSPRLAQACGGYVTGHQLITGPAGPRVHSALFHFSALPWPGVRLGAEATPTDCQLDIGLRGLGQ